MKHIGIRRIETERLVLRKLKMRDVPLFYARLGGSSAVTKYMLWQPHRNVEESAASIQKTLQRYEAGGFYRWAIALRESGEIIGMIDLLRFCEDLNSCSFAYMLGEEFWGQGYGTEALRVVLDFAFTQLEIQTVEAEHFAQNMASGAVMRKVGMQYQGTIPGKYEKNGTKYDACLYRITVQAWNDRLSGRALPGR